MILGLLVGAPVGFIVGSMLGPLDGALVGDLDGSAVIGSKVGAPTGGLGLAVVGSAVLSWGVVGSFVGR